MIYEHQSHFICQCGKRKNHGQHVCNACLESAPEDLRKRLDRLEPGDMRHIQAAREIIDHARSRHEHVGTMGLCTKCNRAKIKKGNDWIWSALPGCFTPQPGWIIEKVLCPDCSADHIALDA